MVSCSAYLIPSFRQYSTLCCRSLLAQQQQQHLPSYRDQSISRTKMRSRSIWLWGLLACGTASPAQPPPQWILGSPVDKLHDIEQRLKAAEIIPTVIDDFYPRFILHVDWPDHQHATLGNIMKPRKLQHQPSFKLYSETHHVLGSDSTYVITITDPDAPSRNDPKWSEFCHFIATGIPSPTASQLDDRSYFSWTFDHSLKDVISYKPPGPPPKTGKHRYVMLVFTPANGTAEELHLSKPSGRKHWGYEKSGHGVRDWASENGLVPVAANFIFAQNKRQ